MTKTRIAIHGAAGRMGRRLVALATADPQFSLDAALDAPGHPELGQDAGLLAGVGPLDIPISATLDREVDVVIDFSLPEAVEAVIDLCVERRTALVLATTGLGERHIARRDEAASLIPLLWAPSMSMAVNLAMKLSTLAGETLKDKDADVEILERHHRFKEDAPSGTALKFGQLISDAMGQTHARHGRQGRPGRRPHDEIGYHAIRVGDNPGEHTIVFAMLGETLEITVRATNRDCYAQGALAAAAFLAGKPPGTYGINDVLGL